MEPVTLVHSYYEALDEGDYDRLDALLAPTFEQERSDRHFESRDAFVEFMREGRPQRDTEHVVDHVVADGDRVVAEGMLFDEDGDLWFRFADVFRVEEGRLAHLRTYTL